MAIKVLVARQMRDRFRFVLHLDTAKMDPANPIEPDPRWLLARDWPLKDGPQKSAYLAAIREELRGQALERIAQLQDEDAGGTPLAIEGQTF